MKLTRPSPLLIGAWIAGLTAVVSLTTWALGEAAKHLIERSAEHTAVRYAQTISAYLPELPKLFSRQPVTPHTLEELAQLRSLGDVFRFKLFDRNGGLLLVSDHLGLPDALYFDGRISRLYAPGIGRADAGFRMGPIVGVLDRTQTGG